MPIYNYKCEKCGVDLEIIHKITETPEIKCEFCGGKTKKIFHPVGIIFKGSGFYKTDSCSKKSLTSNSSGNSSSDKPTNKK